LQGKLALAGVMVVLVAGLVTWGGVSWKRAGQAQVDQTMTAVNRDVAKLSGKLPNLDEALGFYSALPSLTSLNDPQGFMKADQRFDTVVAVDLRTVDQQSQLVSSDQAIVNDAVSRLGDAEGNWATTGNHARLDAAINRIGYARLAMDEAATLAQISGSQLKATRDVIDALAAFGVVAQYLDSNDLQDALNAHDKVRSLLYQAQTDGETAHFDPVWNTLLQDVSKLVDDTRAAVQDVIQHGAALGGRDPYGISADVVAIKDLDTSALDKNAYAQDLLAQMKSNLRQAGLSTGYNSL
jgi:hypothetical protein